MKNTSSFFSFSIFFSLSEPGLISSGCQGDLIGLNFYHLGGIFKMGGIIFVYRATKMATFGLLYGKAQANIFTIFKL